MSEQTNYKVYMLTLTDGRVYIGMTRQKLNHRCRKDGYIHCPAMGKAVEDFGWEAFKLSVIADNLSCAEAEQIEKENIAKYDSTNPLKGFNVALGGNIVGRHSEVTRRKMSEGQKGKKLSDEHLSHLRKPKMNGALRRTILQYDADGNLIREHDSLIDATKSVDGWMECIVRCCNHKQHTHKGYRWEYGRRVTND